MRALDILPQAGKRTRHAMDAFLDGIASEEASALLARGAVCALSGGADSVLLLKLAHSYASHIGLPLAALHVHHGIRGEEADRDEAFCRAFCEAEGIPLFVMHEDVPAYCAAHSLGLEEGARQVRYACFSRLLAEQPQYSCILTAHNSTDNLETLLLNMMRGSGLRGLCGIPPVRAPYVRPLLALSRKDILAALEELGLSYVTDSTNADISIPRNYVRAELLPRLSPLAEDSEAAAGRLIFNLREEEEAACFHARELFAKYEKNGSLPRAFLASQPRATARRLIALLYEKAGGNIMAERAHYAPLLDALPGRVAHEFCFPSGLYARLTDETLSFGHGKEETKAADYEIPLTLGCNPLGENRGEIRILEEPDAEFEKRSLFIYNLFIQAKIDSATIIGSLTARNRRKGDRYRYGGMTRDVRRLMSGAHLPQRLRDVLPLVCDSEGILWVPGFGVREGEKSGGKTLYIYYCNGKAESD